MMENMQNPCGYHGIRDSSYLVECRHQTVHEDSQLRVIHISAAPGAELDLWATGISGFCWIIPITGEVRFVNPEVLLDEDSFGETGYDILNELQQGPSMPSGEPYLIPVGLVRELKAEVQHPKIFTGLLVEAKAPDKGASWKDHMERERLEDGGLLGLVSKTLDDEGWVIPRHEWREIGRGDPPGTEPDDRPASAQLLYEDEYCVAWDQFIGEPGKQPDLPSWAPGAAPLSYSQMHLGFTTWEKPQPSHPKEKRARVPTPSPTHKKGAWTNTIKSQVQPESEEEDEEPEPYEELSMGPKATWIPEGSEDSQAPYIKQYAYKGGFVSLPYRAFCVQVQPKTVDLQALISVCIDKAGEAGAEIMAVHAALDDPEDPVDLGLQYKDEDYPVTTADLRAQAIIVNGLSKAFKGIHIIAEEDTEVVAEQEVTGATVDLTALRKEVEEYPIPSHLQELERDEVSVWVDPLNGTQSFADRQLDEVSVLIGIAYKGTPVAGILHLPQERRTVWGVAGGGVKSIHGQGCHYSGPAADQTALRGVRATCGIHGSGSPERPKYTTVGVDASSYDTPSEASKLRRIFETEEGFELRRSGPVGVTAVKVLEGKLDAFCTKGFKWDTCAVEALLLAAGGGVTDLQGSRYWYHQDATEPNMGMVVGTMPGLYTRLKAMLWGQIARRGT